MSEPKLISPMLDNFVMGDPMSEHHGVRCCPAMAKDSDNKYIVKIISIPASQVQLEALLLTGAYQNSASALEYFKELTDGVVEEAQTLQRLSKLEGFLPYESWQVVPMENAVGYDVYLLGSYKRSLQRYFRRHTMTHLQAVNLGLDLCAAMAVCRRSGMLYVDLKPENVYITDDFEYRVGDLGFVPLDSLQYASLPDRYRSSYTAPEVKDAFASLNPTLDIYATGMILYQAYNDGTLPFEGQAPDDPLPAPMYADYELAEIILKACAPKPEDRWQDPIQMGQALVSYMQRNGVNDTPIVPQAPQPQEASKEETPASEEDTELNSIIQEVITDEPTDGESDADDETDLSFMDAMLSDETAPNAENADGVEYHELTDDTSTILFQADELIAHEAPEPVVAPEPIDIPLPPPIVFEPEEPASEDTLPAEPEPAEVTEDAEDPDETVDEEYEDYIAPRKKGAGKRIAIFAVVILLLIGSVCGGYYFYENYYLQNIDDMVLKGTENQLTVQVDTEMDETLLTVVCVDTHGNKLEKPLTAGIAHFNNLNPNTIYKVTLEVEGFHELTGNTSGSYTTPPQTNIIDFTATTGSEDGAVVLRFTIDGQEPEQWRIVYSAEGEEEQSVTSTSHTVTIKGLTVGKTYTFRLEATSPLYIVGDNELTFEAEALTFAQNLAITACQGDSLTAVWEAPEGVTVESWSVRCYNDSGFEQTITTSETQATFTGLDTTSSYSVEVIADGMVMGSHAYVTANSVTVSNFEADTSDRNYLEITWDHTGKAPEGGWLMLYTINGSAHQEVIRCESNRAVIAPMIPDASYQMTLQAADGVTVFGGSFSTETPEAEMYEGYTIDADDLYFYMCLTPEESNWKYNDVDDDDFTTTFEVGQKASFLVRLYVGYDYDQQDVVTMFLIRDEAGNIISSDTDVRTWDDMWFDHRCELDIPAMPETPGNYTVTIYFDGYYAGEESFTIVEAE